MKYTIIIILLLLVTLIIHEFIIDPKHNIRHNKFKTDVLVNDLLNFGDETTRVGIYTEDEKLGTYAKGFTNVSFKTLLGKSETKLQYKTNLTQEHPVDMRVRQFVKNELGLNPNNTKLRVCTGPWTFKAHFDTVGNYALLLYGTKDFLIFDLYNHKHEIEILEEMKHKNNEETMKLLNEYSIPYKLYKLKPGDVLYIKPSIYHKVESDGPSMLLNIDTKNKCVDCGEKFDKLWPKQKKVCTTNNCLY
jgi:hypothetical protein